MVVHKIEKIDNSLAYIILAWTHQFASELREASSRFHSQLPEMKQSKARFVPLLFIGISQDREQLVLALAKGSLIAVQHPGAEERARHQVRGNIAPRRVRVCRDLPEGFTRFTKLSRVKVGRSQLIVPVSGKHR